MYINYLILVHKNLAQVDRLIDNLIESNTFIYLHIDKRVSRSEIMRCRFSSNQNVRIIKNRIAVNWGGYSMVQATLNLMKTACDHNREGYFILLSGQDFPLQSTRSIYAYLHDKYGKEFLHYWRLPYKNWMRGGLDRIKYYWFVDKIGMYASNLFVDFQKENKMERDYFKDFPPYGGSQWWCLTTACVQHILNFIKQNPIIIDYFESTLIPDESFFHTIIMNSRFQDNVINDNLRYIIFEGGKPNPKVFGINDFSSLVNSKKLWARKFNMTHDNLVLDELESHNGYKNISPAAQTTL